MCRFTGKAGTFEITAMNGREWSKHGVEFFSQSWYSWSRSRRNKCWKIIFYNTKQKLSQMKIIPKTKNFTIIQFCTTRENSSKTPQFQMHFFHLASLVICQFTIGRVFKETLRNRLNLTWAWPKVLSMAPNIQILNKWVWPDLFSLSLLRASLVITNEWEEAFLWPIAVIVICVAIHRGK